MAASAFRIQGLYHSFARRSCKTWLDNNRHVNLAVVSQRSLHTSQVLQEKSTNVVASKAAPELENYIPITRRSMVRHLIQAKEVLNFDEQSKFDKFANALDSVVVRRHEFVLQELKTLFEPINPDKDTIATRSYTRRDRLDNEFSLLTGLASVMERANFRELDGATIRQAITQHSASHGVTVIVNPNTYDTLRVWVLGKEQKAAKYSPPKRLARFALGRSGGGPTPVYQRLVLVVRRKRDDKLMIKAFKDAPIAALDQILPERELRMTTFDKVVFSSCLTLSSAGLLLKFTAYLAQVYTQWSLAFSALFAVLAMRSYTGFKNRQNDYMSTANEHLYHNNVANNHGLLTLLVVRAADEMVKESLLAYTFLLTARQPSVHDKNSCDQLVEEIGNLTPSELESRIEGWVQRRTGAHIRFDARQSLALLSELGLVRHDSETDRVSVLPLDTAMRNLSLTPRSLVPRGDDADVIEGYDRDAFDKWIEESSERPRGVNPLAWLNKKQA